MVEIANPPTTKEEIIKTAVQLVGKQQTVNTIDGGGTLATNASDLYDTLVSAEMASNRWRFCQEFQEISIINNLSPNFDGWLYYAVIPADALMVLYVTPTREYLVFGENILLKSNQNFTLVFTKYVPVSKWPGAFSMYIAYHLAAMLGISVSNSDRLLARLDAGLKAWESRALFADGQSSSTKPIKFNPYVEVRYQSRTRRG